MRKSTLKTFTIITCVATILLIAPTTIASTGWIRTYQGEAMDILTPDSVVQTSDGGYATVTSGYIRRIDNVGYTGHFNQSYELQIMKTTSNGDVQWRQNFTQIDDPNNETPSLYEYTKPHIIVQTADKGYVIASSGTDMFWMFKVDHQGKVLWTKAYTQNEENPSASSLYSMIQTNDGGFALAGSTFTSEGGTDFWLVKTDSKGKAQWNQTYNSGTFKDSMGTQYPREDEAKTVIQTRDGGYALAGSASLYRASTSSVVYASWMVKTDAQGNHLWNKGYDAPNESREYSIIQTTDNGYAIAGTLNENFYLMKIASTGQLQWNKTYGDKLTDTPCALVQLNDDGYAIAGTWTKTDTTTTVSTMGLLRLDSIGETIWTKTYNAKENPPNVSHDLAKTMIRATDGSYVIVGSSLYDSETHQDIFFVKTETLEQPPQPTATQSQSSTLAPTSIPTGNPTSTLTGTPAGSPTTLPTQTITSSSSSPQPSPSIPEIPIGITISLFIAATAILLVLSKKKLN
jgi:hypothetical protein